jgi:hypothetical protein
MKGVCVETSEAYQKGVTVVQGIDPEQDQRLLQLQELAQSQGYEPDEWRRPSHEQILFILGVCDRFRDDRLKVSDNWLDLDTSEA